MSRILKIIYLIFGRFVLVTNIDTTKKLQFINKIIYVKNVALYLEHSKNSISLLLLWLFFLLVDSKKFQHMNILLLINIFQLYV